MENEFDEDKSILGVLEKLSNDPRRKQREIDVNSSITATRECPMEFQGLCSLLDAGPFGQYAGMKLYTKECLPELVEVEEVVKKCRVCSDSVEEIQQMMFDDLYPDIV